MRHSVAAHMSFGPLVTRNGMQVAAYHHNNIYIERSLTFLNESSSKAYYSDNLHITQTLALTPYKSYS